MTELYRLMQQLRCPSVIFWHALANVVEHTEVIERSGILLARSELKPTSRFALIASDADAFVVHQPEISLGDREPLGCGPAIPLNGGRRIGVNTESILVQPTKLVLRFRVTKLGQ